MASSIDKILRGPSAKKQAKVEAWGAATQRVYEDNAASVQTQIDSILDRYIKVEEGKALTPSEVAHNERLKASLDFWTTFQLKASGLNKR